MALSFDFTSPELRFEFFDFQTLCILSTLSKEIQAKACDVMQGMETGTMLLENLVRDRSKQQKRLNSFSQRNIDDIIYTLHTNFGDRITLLASNYLFLDIVAKFELDGANYTVDKRFQLQLVPDVCSNTYDLVKTIKDLIGVYHQDFVDEVCPVGEYNLDIHWSLRDCQVFQMHYGYSFRTLPFTLNLNSKSVPPMIFNSQTNFIAHFVNRFYVM